MNLSQRSYSPRFLGNKSTERLVFIGAILLFVTGFISALCLGATDINPVDAFSAILKGDKTDPAYRIFLFVRLPRALAALLSGMALAASGVIIQAVLNNPMAAPNIIGVNSGAGLAAVIMLSVFPSALAFLPLAAFLGAVAACLLIYLISAKSGAERLTVTLVGIAVSSILNAAINMVKTLFPDSVYDTDMFLIGGLSGATYTTVIPAGILIFFSAFAVLFLSKRLDIITLGDQTAASLGMNLKATKLLLLVIASALAGAAVSFAGLLGFVGLLIPHIAGRFCKRSHKKLLPLSMLLGSTLVLWCDILGRTVAAPYEISVGILLSFIGGPFFISLILFKRRGYGD